MQRVDRSQFVGEQIAQPLEMKGKSLRFVKYCNLIFLSTRCLLLVCGAGSDATFRCTFNSFLVQTNCRINHVESQLKAAKVMKHQVSSRQCSSPFIVHIILSPACVQVASWPAGCTNLNIG